MLDYPGVAENIINHEKDQLKHWGIVDTHSEFIKHQSAFESCCEEAQKPVAGHINPSKFLNHLASSCDEHDMGTFRLSCHQKYTRCHPGMRCICNES